MRTNVAVEMLDGLVFLSFEKEVAKNINYNVPIGFRVGSAMLMGAS
jgi:hypothetical protein